MRIAVPATEPIFTDHHMSGPPKALTYAVTVPRTPPLPLVGRGWGRGSREAAQHCHNLPILPQASAYAVAVPPLPLPPCGGRSGWGSGGFGTVMPHSSAPTPNPSPQGGGEEFAAPPQPNLPPHAACRRD